MTMTDREWATSLTADDCERAITACLEKRDMKAVVGFLYLLAVKAPDRAQTFLDALELARALRDG